MLLRFLQGLQHIVEAFETENYDKSKIDEIIQNDTDSLDNLKPKSLSPSVIPSTPTQKHLFGWRLIVNCLESNIVMSDNFFYWIYINFYSSAGLSRSITDVYTDKHRDVYILGFSKLFQSLNHSLSILNCFH